MKFTSSSARAIDAATPSSRPRRRLEIEKRLRDREQDIVACGLNVGSPCVNHPPCRQRIINRIGDADEEARPAADEEILSALPEIRHR